MEIPCYGGDESAHLAVGILSPKKIGVPGLIGWECGTFMTAWRRCIYSASLFMLHWAQHRPGLRRRAKFDYPCYYGGSSYIVVFSALHSNNLNIQAILDFNSEFNVSTFDQVVTQFYSGSGQQVRPAQSGSNRRRLIILSQQQLAQQVLTQFQEHPEAWTRVPIILESSSFSQAKALSIYHFRRNLSWSYILWI